MIVAPTQERWKKLKTIDYVSGGDGIFSGSDIGFNKYRAFKFYFTSTFNKSGAASFGTLAAEAPFTILRDVSWYNGKEQVKKLPATFLRQISHPFFRGVDTDYTAPAAANSNQTTEFSLVLDHAMFNTDSPDLTLENLTSDLTSAQLKVKFGTVEDLIAGGDYATKALASATLTLFGLIDNRPAGIYSSHHYEFIEKQISSNPQTRFVVPINTDQWINWIMGGQYTKTPDTPLSNTLFADANEISIEVNGVPIWGPMTFLELRRINKADNLIALGTGYWIVDFTRDGKYPKSLNAYQRSGVNQVDLIVQTSSVANAYGGFAVGSVRGPVLARA